jgi:hypothetical protein
MEMEGALWRVLIEEVQGDSKNQRCIQKDSNKGK